MFAILGGHDTPEHYYADVWVASAEGARSPGRCVVAVRSCRRVWVLTGCVVPRVDAVLCLNEGVSCSGHGVCTTTRGCDCAFGWAGPYCTTAVCHAADCVNGECSAVPSGDGQYCKCAAMWGGPRCDIPECSKGVLESRHGACDVGGQRERLTPDCPCPAPCDSTCSFQAARRCMEAVPTDPTPAHARRGGLGPTARYPRPLAPSSASASGCQATRTCCSKLWAAARCSSSCRRVCT